MSKNFVILFNGHEGTSPLVRLLDNFGHIDVLHHDDGGGWEPFDSHNCGRLPARAYEQSLNLIFGDIHPYMHRLNEIYTKTARGPLADFDKGNSIGFKMRFHTQTAWKLAPAKRYKTARFRKISFDVFRNHDIVVFSAIRQDVFRWALSRYHGDGMGHEGHIQFKLASKEISRSQISKIEVDFESFERTVVSCERSIERKRDLLDDLTESGITAYPLLYEEFCDDKVHYFRQLLDKLEIRVSNEELERAIGMGAYFEKVHGDDIGEFVTNASEVVQRFGHRYVSWYGTE